LGAAVGGLGAERRGRHLLDVSRAANLAVPAALARDLEAGSAGPPLVARAALSVVHDPVRDVAPDGLLSDDPGRARRCSAHRRLLAAQGAGPRDPSDLDSRNPHCGDLLVLALRERVRLRDHVHLGNEAAHDLGRRADGSDPRRRLLLAVADGRNVDPEHPARAALQQLSQPFHRRLYGRCVSLTWRTKGRRETWPITLTSSK